MYKKKIPLDLDCGVAIAMEVMGGKWKSCILYELEKGCKRPSELQENNLSRTSAPRGIFHYGRRTEPYAHYPDAGTMGK